MHKTCIKNKHVHGCNTRANRSESKGGGYDISQSVFPLLSPVFELCELKRKQRGNKNVKINFMGSGYRRGTREQIHEHPHCTWVQFATFMHVHRFTHCNLLHTCIYGCRELSQSPYPQL